MFNFFKNDRTNVVAYGDAHFGQGTGDIYFDDLECNGSEKDLLSCRRSLLGHHNCGHSEDAGVQCGKKYSDYQQIYGNIRILK